MFLVLNGTVYVTIGDERHVLEAGDVAWVPRGEVHGFGTGGTSGTLLAVDTPQPLDGYFRDLMAAFPPGTRPDPEIAGQIMARHDTHRIA